MNSMNSLKMLTKNPIFLKKVRFMVDGERIAADDTAEKLGLEEIPLSQWIVTPPNGCFLKWWYPQNTRTWSFLVGKPIVVGYHHFRFHPQIKFIWYWRMKVTNNKRYVFWEDNFPKGPFEHGQIVVVLDHPSWIWTAEIRETILVSL